MFGSPSMLWWAAAAAVPILIHLFARQRFRRVQWAAMEFLRRAFQKTKRRIRLENLLLLLLRVAALVLLALAVADPQLKASLLPGGADTRREVVVIVDTSFSMGYREASGETPFRRAHDNALKLVRNLRSERGDTATLITAGKPAAPVLVRTNDLERVAAEIDGIEVSDATTDLVGALRLVVSLVGEARGFEVFLFTDLQRASLVPPSQDASKDEVDAAPELGAILDQIKLKGGRVSLLPTGVGDADNLAITDLHVASKASVVHQPVRFSATVRNFGQRPASGILHLFVDGSESGVEAQVIDLLAPGATFAADFQHTFREAGPHEVDVRFSTDALEIDNRRALSTHIADRLGVLIVDASAGAEDGEEASFFLRTALALGGTATRPPTFDVKVVNELQFEGEDLALWQLVVLADTQNLSDRRARDLEEFVVRGGGLLIFTGERTQAARVNELLFRDGAGVLPAAIGDVVGQVDTRQPAFEPRPLIVDRPPLLYFADEKIRAALIGVPVYRFHAVTLPADAPSVSVLAQFESLKAAVAQPSPAMIEKTSGRGRVILVTSSADRSWNELAVFPTYVPLVRELAYHLVKRPERFENLLVGDSYTHQIDRFVQEVVVERAGKQIEVIKPTARAGGGGFEFRIDGFPKASTYRLTYVEAAESSHKPMPPTYVAVNVDPTESDLARVRPDTLAGLFTPDQLRVIDALDAERDAQAAPGGKAWWWILVLVLGVLVGETALAQIFGRTGRGGVVA